MEKEVISDYNLDGLESKELTPDQITQTRFTRRVVRGLDYILIGAIVVGSLGYGAYRCLPEPAKQTINNVCINISQYLSFSSS